MSSSYFPGVYRQNSLNQRRAGNAKRTSRSKDVTKKQRDIKISKVVEPQDLGTEEPTVFINYTCSHSH